MNLRIDQAYQGLVRRTKNLGFRSKAGIGLAIGLTAMVLGYWARGSDSEITKQRLVDSLESQISAAGETARHQTTIDGHTQWMQYAQGLGIAIDHINGDRYSAAETAKGNAKTLLELYRLQYETIDR